MGHVSMPIHRSNGAGGQGVTGQRRDADPYFRWFNPVLQGEKFDPTGTRCAAG